MPNYRTGAYFVQLVVLLACDTSGPVFAQAYRHFTDGNLSAVQDQGSTSFSLQAMLAKAGAADADLNGLAIASADRLCAVGNGGVILLSNNAGRVWSLVESPTAENLHAVTFLESEQNGLAVGGTIGTFSGTSRGTILHTIDGGLSWQFVPNELPRLVGLRFQEKRLIAWGDYSPSFRTGIFESRDGGLSWQPIGLPLAHVNAAAASPQGELLAADISDKLDHFSLRGGLQSTHTAHRIHALQHTGAGWLATGDRGTLMFSQDGRGWSPVHLPMRDDSRSCCDWRTIHQTGDEIWVAGSPGSMILHSSDRGVTWTIKPTGHPGPIADVKFLDQDRGWAVGPQGKILATRDGGQSWYPQRQSNKHLGVLSITRTTSQIPFAPLLSASWEEGVSVAALVMPEDLPDEQADFRPGNEAQLLALAPQVGISSGRIPINPQTTPEAAAQRLAITLLCRQPDVILIGESHAEQVPLSFDMAAAARAAISMAENPTATIPEIINDLHLQPWRVTKLVTLCEAGQTGYREQSQRVLKSLGLAIWDLLLRLPPEVGKAAETTVMTTLWSKTRNRAAESALMGGVAIRSDARREIVLSGLGNYQLVMGREYRQKSVEQLVNAPGAIEKWSQDLSFVMQNHPEHEVAPALWRLAKNLGAVDQTERRQVVLETMIELGPTSDVATWAMVELLEEYASDELAAWVFADVQLGRSTPMGLAAASAATHVSPTVSAQPDPRPWNATPFASEPTASLAVNDVLTASATVSTEKVAIPPDPRTWFELYSTFCARAPRLIARPDLQLLAYRMSHREGGAELARLESMLTGTQLTGWQRVARQELLLGLNRLEELEWIALAVRTNARPQLDGVLDEAFWSRVPPMQLAGEEGTEADPTQPGATTRWAYDSRYLYVAIECAVEQRVTLPPVKRLRSYDAELSGQDFVALSLDTDRDYATSIEIAISQEGQTYDRCLDRKEFDPKWHVSVENQEAAWTAELAIDLRYLTTHSNLTGEAWAISAKRQRPGGGLQTWGRSKTRPPRLTDTGLLLFLPRQEQNLGD